MKLTNKTLTEMFNRIGGSDVKRLAFRKMKRVWKSDVAFRRYRCEVLFYRLCLIYVVGSKSFRPDIQKPRQLENAVRDI